jgi:hypothetical protein
VKISGREFEQIRPRDQWVRRGLRRGSAFYYRAEELLQRKEAMDREAAERRAFALKARSLNMAATREQRGELRLQRLDYISAVEHFLRRLLRLYRARIAKFASDFSFCIRKNAL